MEDKSISIIIPIYNAESTLKRCIDSIIKQSYKQWTLILINDGSTDDSQTICHNYEVRDNRILLLNKENGVNYLFNTHLIKTRKVRLFLTALFCWVT